MRSSEPSRRGVLLGGSAAAAFGPPAAAQLLLTGAGRRGSGVGGAYPGPYLPMTTAMRGAVYGASLLVSGYFGPLYTLRRLSDNATMEVYPAAGSAAPDYAIIDAWSGGTDPAITTVYDQTGGGNHATQATAGAQPLLSSRLEDISGGIRGIALSWTFGATHKSLQIPNLSLASRNHGFAYVIHQRVNTNPAMIVEFDTSTPAIVSANFAGGPGLGNFCSQGGGSSAAAAGWFLRSEPTVGVFSSSATGRNWNLSEVAKTQAAFASDTVANGSAFLGKSPTAGSTYDGDMTIFAFVVYTSTPSAGDITALTSNTTGLPAIISTRTSGWTNRLIYGGSSLIAGAGKSFGRTPLVIMQLDSSWETYNLGHSGLSLAAEYAGRNSYDFLLVNTSLSRNVLVIDAPHNDMVVFTGTTPFTDQASAEAWADSIYTTTTVPYVAAAKGWHASVRVVVPTMIADGAFTTGNFKEYARLRYNEAVRNGAAANGYAVADRCAFPAFDAPPAVGNAYYIGDRVHPNDTGNIQFAAIDKAAILAAAGS